MIGRYYTSPEAMSEAVRGRRPLTRPPAFSSHLLVWICLGLLLAGMAAFAWFNSTLREAAEQRLEQRQQEERETIEQIHGECQRATPLNIEQQRACVDRAQGRLA